LLALQIEGTSGDKKASCGVLLRVKAHTAFSWHAPHHGSRFECSGAELVRYAEDDLAPLHQALREAGFEEKWE
jgi:hypothetical protein